MVDCTFRTLKDPQRLLIHPTKSISACFRLIDLRHNKIPPPKTKHYPTTNSLKKPKTLGPPPQHNKHIRDFSLSSGQRLCEIHPHTIEDPNTLLERQKGFFVVVKIELGDALLVV